MKRKQIYRENNAFEITTNRWLDESTSETPDLFDHHGNFIAMAADDNSQRLKSWTRENIICNDFWLHKVIKVIKNSY